VDRLSRVEAARWEFKSRRGELMDQLAAVGHHPKVVVYRLGHKTALGYRVKLSCTRCRQSWKRWPLDIWWGLSPRRECPANRIRGSG
jgi:hypothetical protein